MGYLNIVIKDKTNNIERKASIPKKTSEIYIGLTAFALKQNPDAYHNLIENISKSKVNEIIYNLIKTSKPNIRLNLGDIGKDFIEMIDNNLYDITMFVGEDPILKKY